MVTVVCTGGEAPPSDLCLAWLDSSQRIIAADGGLQLLRRLNRKADLWIGDGDSLKGAIEDWSPWYREAKLLDREKDDSDTEAAVRMAIEEGAEEVWLVGGGGGRMDHWWANLRLVANSLPLTRWLTAREEAWNLGQGRHLRVGPGTLSIFPLGFGPWELRSSGLRWALEGLDFLRFHSLSNETETDGAEIFVDAGQVLVIRPFPERESS